MLRSPCFCLLPVLLLCFVPLSSARSEKRLHFAPKFVEGTSLLYRIETRTSSNEHNITPIVDPEGASQYEQSTSLVLRLAVLSAQQPSQASKEGVRFRATFEQADSDSQADAYAPQAAAFDDAIAKLKGQSFEFSIDSGRLTGVQGLTQIAPNRDVAARLLAWVHVLFAPVDLPAPGVEIGQKWTNDRPLTDLPLTGLTWRNESTYLRDEPCAASSGVKSVASPGTQGECAVLLTHFTILRHGSDHSDATPEAYIRNGLRTSGKWTGSGSSLDAISLASGLLVGCTQTATQDTDYQIRSASTDSTIHHTGQTTTQTEITLLLAAPPNP
jgi:hypothetical protein